MTAPDRLLGGRYQLGELLGYGGMAEVHRGRDLRLGRDVAIKMLRSDLARDTTFQMRFRREAQNAAALNHPAIAAIYDTGEERGPNGEPLPYIVMEYVAGRTLKEVLAAEGRLQPRRALEITADICAALEFSHRHGIIHRDVKPGNVMVTPSGQVKVMDFGIARDLGSGATTMTQTSAVIGTAQYLSPEQARGEAVDARSDVYATGCVLFELLCGQPPFVGDSPVAVAYQHVREDPPLVSHLNPEVGPDLDAVVMKALAKNPANRYQSAAEMRADLLRAAAGRPVMATPVLSQAETALLAEQAGARVADDRRRASTWVMVALGVLGVLAVISLIVGLILTNRGSDRVVVPNVTGLTEEAAREALTNLGLVPERGEVVTDADCPVGQVVGQHPAPGGDPVRVGSTVTYDLCLGPNTFEMPNVVGFARDAAERSLRDRGLEVVVEEEDSSAPEGQVVRTEPEAGATVAENDTVTIFVSRGNLVEVPNLSGLTESAALERLAARGFQGQAVQASNEPTSWEQVGTVADQSPAPGEEAPRDSVVQIFIYRDGAPLSATYTVVGDNVVRVEWDNSIYGGVTIDWDDGSDPVTFPDATGSAERALPPGGTYVIRVESINGSGRLETLNVEVPGS